MRERGRVTRISSTEARVRRWAQMVGDSAQAETENNDRNKQNKI